MNYFQLHILNYDEPKIRQDSIKYYCKELTKSLINKVNHYKIYDFDNQKINEINIRYEYYKLFCELNKIYNAKFYFTINKVFQTGELMIILFFIRQYTYIKCQNHYSMINEKYKKHNRCPSCNLAKYFYCQVYSLNEKFFQIQTKIILSKKTIIISSKKTMKTTKKIIIIIIIMKTPKIPFYIIPNFYQNIYSKNHFLLQKNQNY
jgi:hypothetical protein